MARLVDTTWLAAHLDALDVRPIDGTWVMPDGEDALPNGFIPGAVSFDLDVIAAPHPELNHMLPSAEVFADAVSQMGLSHTDHVICRLWWTFRMFGHENISVLNGGLPAWIKSGGAVDDGAASYPASNYTAQTPLSRAVSFEEFCANTEAQIVDARPSGRFNGTAPEPRTNLRGGHVPHSFSLPFGLLRTPDGHFKSLDDISALISAAQKTSPFMMEAGPNMARQMRPLQHRVHHEP